MGALMRSMNAKITRFRYQPEKAIMNKYRDKQILYHPQNNSDIYSAVEGADIVGKSFADSVVRENLTVRNKSEVSSRKQIGRSSERDSQKSFLDSIKDTLFNKGDQMTERSTVRKQIDLKLPYIK